MKNKLTKTILENIKTIFYALLIALIIRSFLFQPFYIPSSSMEPTLLIGDRIFVSKYEYGYSKHSLPFSPPILKNRVFKKIPEYGDLVVFKTPLDNRTDYIKRLIGMPGDTVQFKNGKIYINEEEIQKKTISEKYKIRCGNLNPEVSAFKERLPNGIEYVAVYKNDGTLLNSDKYKVPNDHFFLLGDNRDCSQDSRFLSSVGYVPAINLVGKAKIIFFSNDTLSGSVLKIWNLNKSFRLKRSFKIIK